jgi:hypothetical protein
MPEAIVRLPITNHLVGSDYTVTLDIGSNAQPLNFLLDTGSSALAVGGNVYDPTTDQSAKTTKLLKVASYLSSSFVGGVVQTSISLTDSSTGQSTSLSGVNLAVTYDKRPDNFGNADGIFGLAYKVLDNAYLMPADTWQNQYDSDQVGLGKECDIDPYFDQLADAGLINRKFAFSVQRSLMSARQDNPAADPLNAGIFVLGGGVECSDLYDGGFTSIAVLHEQHYNVNLLSVQVGDQPSIAVQPIAPGSNAPSNAFIDSGTPNLLLDQDLYDEIIAAFGAIDSGFPAALKQFPFGGSSCDQTQIDLGAWPPLKFGFQGSDGNVGIITIAPADYWQFDAAGKGNALAVIGGDDGRMGGQSILGLPIFSGNYVVFDRTQSNGQGAINFARQPAAVQA